MVMGTHEFSAIHEWLLKSVFIYLTENYEVSPRFNFIDIVTTLAYHRGSQT